MIARRIQNGVEAYVFAAVLFCALTLLAVAATAYGRVSSFEFLLSCMPIPAALVVHVLLTFPHRSEVPADVCVFLFSLLFFAVAPPIQLSVLGLYLVNTSPATIERIAFVNVMVAVFVLVYSISYHWLKSQSNFLAPSSPPLSERTPAYSLSGRGFALLALATLLLAPLIAISIAAIGPDGGFSSPLGLVVKKLLMFLPGAIFLTALIAYKDGSRPPTAVPALLICFAVTALFMNPAFEKRNVLGPLYLAIAFVLFDMKRGSKSFLAAMLGIAIFFLLPAAAVFTHSNPSNWNFGALKLELIKEHVLSIHYDAWANIYATTELVSLQGVAFGKQLAGTLLFFVPSSLWPEKPKATGIEIADYLIDYHSMWFTNISSPLIAEGYIDFHIPGVVACAVVLAVFVIGLERTTLRGAMPHLRAAAVYFSFFLVFALRGALMVAVAYGFAALVGFLLIGVLVRFIVANGAGRIGLVLPSDTARALRSQES